MLLRASLIACLATGAFAAAVPASHELHEKRSSLHPRWTKARRVPREATLPMRIGLMQNMENAEQHLMDVSDPASPNYGKHWTAEQVHEAFKPSDTTIEVVHDWLVKSGIEPHRITHTDNKAWFAFDATAAEAEDLLLTEFFEFHDSVTDGIIPSCDEYHLPKHLREHIDMVSPGVKLLAPSGSFHTEPKKKAKRGLKNNLFQPVPVSQDYKQPLPDDLSECDVTLTPACIAALYKLPKFDPHRKVSKHNSMGIFESELQFYTQTDLDLFFANYTPQIPAGTHPIDVAIDGGPGIQTNLSLAGEEAALDIQVAYPIVYPQTITVYSSDDIVYQSDPNITYTYGFNTFLDALDGSYCHYTAYGETGNSPIDPVYPDPRPDGYKGKLQCGVYKPTNVISLSYGGQEADVPANYQKRQCNEYLKLGLQGVSFLYASGDAGVGNYPSPYGSDNPDTGCLGPDGLLFNPTWPNNCPWVTSVGATKVYPGRTVFEPESAVFDPAGHPYHVNYSSGGGFSNLYPVPSYQKSAVSHFFAKHNPPYKSYSKLVSDVADIPSLGAAGGVYNRIGRGIPDVAANGDNAALYNGGVFGRGGGTSQSTPIFASVVNRLNEERILKGKGPIGFLNPALYAHPEVLNDITNGTNPGCWTLGFSAVEGWDPVTGLGTPNYPKMLDLFMSLP